MQFGLPILTSDYDFAREVCADSASYFDPLNPNDIARAIARLSSREGRVLDVRRSIEDGNRRYGASWVEITKRYVEVLRAACGEQSSPRPSYRGEHLAGRVVPNMRGAEN